MKSVYKYLLMGLLVAAFAVLGKFDSSEEVRKESASYLSDLDSCEDLEYFRSTYAFDDDVGTPEAFYYSTTQSSFEKPLTPAGIAQVTGKGQKRTRKPRDGLTTPRNDTSGQNIRKPPDIV